MPLALQLSPERLAGLSLFACCFRIDLAADFRLIARPRLHGREPQTDRFGRRPKTFKSEPLDPVANREGVIEFIARGLEVR